MVMIVGIWRFFFCGRRDVKINPSLTPRRRLVENHSPYLPLVLGDHSVRNSRRTTSRLAVWFGFQRSRSPPQKLFFIRYIRNKVEMVVELERSEQGFFGNIITPSNELRHSCVVILLIIKQTQIQTWRRKRETLAGQVCRMGKPESNKSRAAPQTYRMP